MAIAGIYYDGQSARRHVVTIDYRDQCLSIRGETVERTVERGAFVVPPPLGNTPRLIVFPDGARCESTELTRFDALLGDTVDAAANVHRLEAHWRYALSALAITVALVVTGYLWGLPRVAERVAEKLPDSLLTTIDERFFATVDDRLLKPSKLHAERQLALRERIGTLRLPGGMANDGAKVHFRRAELGANAFALPGGSIVILDDLVELAANDEEIVAVVAHEIGHVVERHALRQTLQASVVGLALAWYVGDVSNLLAIAPASLLETRYSRDFERQADAFAARVLSASGIPASRLADMLDKLERAHGGKEPVERPGGRQGADFLSTHPNTAERIRKLRASP